MALIHEELKHEYLPVSLMVSQRQQGECIEPWDIVHCEVDGMSRMTPKQLQELGRWLVQQGKRLGREYKSNGAPRAASASASDAQANRAAITTPGATS
jgi:hypothetical protein